MRTDIRNKFNMPIGYMETIGSDRVQGYTIKSGYVGYYNKSTDITFDRQGRIYCHGDGLASLIRENS